MEIQLRRSDEEIAALYGDDAVREIELEERMVSLGRGQIRKQINAAKERGSESATGYGKTLVAMSVEKIGTAIGEFIEKAESSGAGRRHTAVKYLKQIDHEVAAFIAMRCVVDSLTGKKQVLQRAAITIGSRIEDEVRFTRFAEEERVGYNRGYQRAVKGTSYHRKKTTMAGFERRYMEDEWETWGEDARLQIGMALIDMIVKTDLVEVGDEVVTRAKTNKVLVPTAKLVEWIERETQRSELLSPSYLPMIVRPLPWTNPFDGGYLTKDAQSWNTLVKTGNSNYLTELADHAEEMPMVYDSINALQDTAWRINPRVYATLNELWNLGHDNAGLPSREDIGAVPCPNCGAAITIAKLNTRHSEEHECFADPDVLRQWKKDAFRTHEKNVSLRSKRLHVAKTLRIAEMFVDEEAIYFPYQLDFRGRIYCIPSFNPQGNDVTKGLLEFAEGLPIEDTTAAFWLAVQGANVWGFDKASLEERVAWVEKHEEMIKAVAADPLGNMWWTTPKKKFQFLAFCFEWAAFLETGFGYVSRLPVALDGSCSGIQHFSAMLRDEVGGNAVNLVPTDQPQDIYQQVCDRVVEKLKKIAGTSVSGSMTPCMDELTDTIAKGTDLGSLSLPLPFSPQSEKGNGKTEGNLYVSEKDFAVGWLSLSPNRDTTKRQVMTLPYGSTLYSCREYTETWLKETLEEYDEPWPTELRFPATQFMARLIWDAIGEVVVAARAAMGWLQSCAKEVAAEELPVYWTTPVGFRVMQQYRNSKSQRVNTKLGETTVKLSLRQEQKTIDKRRMQNAISPNFVHSMDATHLMMSVCYGADNGIKSFSLIHDSFGTHAANTELWSACIREAFVDLYKDLDVLEDFRQQIIRQVSDPERVKRLPKKGGLDIEIVRSSDFAFA